MRRKNIIDVDYWKNQKFKEALQDNVSSNIKVKQAIQNWIENTSNSEDYECEDVSELKKQILIFDNQELDVEIKNIKLENNCYFVTVNNITVSDFITDIRTAEKLFMAVINVIELLSFVKGADDK